MNIQDVIDRTFKFSRQDYKPMTLMITDAVFDYRSGYSPKESLERLVSVRRTYKCTDKQFNFIIKKLKDHFYKIERGYK